jgi:hypothetical protein
LRVSGSILTTGPRVAFDPEKQFGGHGFSPHPDFVVLCFVMPRRPAPASVNYQLILSVSAIFLSLLGLLVSGYQARIARENQHMSVWPHLKADVSVMVHRDFIFKLTNDGVGPAIIRTVAVHQAGRDFPEHMAFFKFIQDRLMGNRVDSFYVASSTLEAGDVLRAGIEQKLHAVGGNGRLVDSLSGIVMDSSFVFETVYSDVYANCWQTRFQGGHSQTIPCRCPDR